MDVSQCLIKEENMALNFKGIKQILETRDATIFVDWTRASLEEINANVTRSLLKKYGACKHGPNAAKVAGCYAFWIAKLKPMFTVITNFTTINEYAGIATGISYIQERLGVQIRLDRDETLNICDTLRYHTSSPHAMSHMFTLWAEREKLKSSAPVRQ